MAGEPDTVDLLRRQFCAFIQVPQILPGGLKYRILLHFVTFIDYAWCQRQPAGTQATKLYIP